MTIFHLSAAPDAATMTEDKVRQTLAVLSGKKADDEGINLSIQQIIDKPNVMHAIGVLKLQYRLSYTAWEGEVVEIVAEALQVSRSDASGVVEGQPFCMQQSWGKGMNAQQTATKLLVEAQR
ncbi:hypothetical protein [Pseudomonas brenneri]|uniref:hypothetical protein n=1 Tax=Pseudomonas brenneri TaxID=129817 RepID=UPI003BA1CC13